MRSTAAVAQGLFIANPANRGYRAPAPSRRIHSTAIGIPFEDAAIGMISHRSDVAIHGIRPQEEGSSYTLMQSDPSVMEAIPASLFINPTCAVVIRMTFP